jgi:hypothetical protein
VKYRGETQAVKNSIDTGRPTNEASLVFVAITGTTT